MTDEELEKLIQETSEQLDKLSDADKPLAKEERRRKLVLELQGQVLQKIKDAKEKGHLQQEIRACMDYAVLKNYGGKHPLIFNYIHSMTRWYGL
jgi:hypothetical protein